MGLRVHTGERTPVAGPARMVRQVGSVPGPGNRALAAVLREPGDGSDSARGAIDPAALARIAALVQAELDVGIGPALEPRLARAIVSGEPNPGSPSQPAEPANVDPGGELESAPRQVPGPLDSDGEPTTRSAGIGDIAKAVSLTGPLERLRLELTDEVMRYLDEHLPKGTLAAAGVLAGTAAIATSGTVPVHTVVPELQVQVPRAPWLTARVELGRHGPEEVGISIDVSALFERALR